jgi:hypothetical protein
MHRVSQSAQEPPPERHSTSKASRWLVAAVGVCGALAGGSIVETIAAFASGSSIAVSPDRLLAEPLVLAGALSGGLLAAILVMRDHSNSQQADRALVDSLLPVEILPSEPMSWQPVPPLLPNPTTLAATSMPAARSKRAIPRIRRRPRLRTSRAHQGRLAVSRLSALKDVPHRG